MSLTVLVQEVWDGRVWSARPMHVVQDNRDLTVLWFPRGTHWQCPTAAHSDGRTRAERLSETLANRDWVFVEREWDVDTLQLWRPGDWHAVWVSWLPSGEHWGWYVNIQRPYVRTERGFATMDLVLDVIVEPNFTWHYKDEDELEVFVELGVFDAALDARIRDEARHAIEAVEARRPPFGERWQDRRPPSGPLPQLPEGWDRCR